MIRRGCGRQPKPNSVGHATSLRQVRARRTQQSRSDRLNPTSLRLPAAAGQCTCAPCVCVCMARDPVIWEARDSTLSVGNSQARWLCLPGYSSECQNGLRNIKSEFCLTLIRQNIRRDCRKKSFQEQRPPPRLSVRWSLSLSLSLFGHAPLWRPWERFQDCADSGGTRTGESA